MVESTFPVDGVCKLLKDANITKASGPDSIPAHIMKEMAQNIAPIMTLSSSSQQAKFPTTGRPQIKNQSTRKVITVMGHYNTHNILIDSHHGFPPGHSCKLQLIITAHDFAKSLNDRKQTDSIIPYF